MSGFLSVKKISVFNWVFHDTPNIYLDICLVNTELSKYIWILIWSIHVHPNIFCYLNGQFLGIQI